MQTTEMRCLDFKLKFSVPSTVEEYDQLAKEVGSCLTSAIKNVLYRGSLAVFRDKFCEAIGEQTKIERLTKKTGKTKTIKVEGQPDTTEDIETWAETEVEYYNRIVATLAVNGLSSDAVIASHVDLAQSIADSIVFDPSARESVSSGPKKMPKIYLAAATAIVNGGNASKAAAKLSAKLNHPVGEDVDSLAAAIREDKLAQEKNLANDYV